MAGKKNRFKREPLLEFKISMPKEMYKLAEKKANEYFERNKCAYGRSLFQLDLNCDEQGRKLNY